MNELRQEYEHICFHCPLPDCVWDEPKEIKSRQCLGYMLQKADIAAEEGLRLLEAMAGEVAQIYLHLQRQPKNTRSKISKDQKFLNNLRTICDHQPFTISHLGNLGYKPKTLYNYCLRLHKAGYLERLDQGLYRVKDGQS